MWSTKTWFLIASDEPSERKAFSSMEKSMKRIFMFISFACPNLRQAQVRLHEIKEKLSYFYHFFCLHKRNETKKSGPFQRYLKARLSTVAKTARRNSYLITPESRSFCRLYWWKGIPNFKTFLGFDFRESYTATVDSPKAKSEKHANKNQRIKF